MLRPSTNDWKGNASIIMTKDGSKKVSSIIVSTDDKEEDEEEDDKDEADWEANKSGTIDPLLLPMITSGGGNVWNKSNGGETGTTQQN